MNDRRLHQLLGAQSWFQALSDAVKVVEKKHFPGEKAGTLYLGAGALQQTVWNIAHDFPADRHFKDLDIVYFDKSSSKDRDFDDALAAELRALMQIYGKWPLDVKNQAHVHEWYAERFGYAIAPYRSLPDAVGSWPTTSTAVAVQLNQGDLTSGLPDLIAPFDLEDLFALVVRANRRQITEEIYAAKVARWRPLWPRLTILPWSEGINGANA